MPDVLVVIGVGGMGENIARRVGAGMTVLLADFNPVTLENASERLSNDGFVVETSEVDVSSAESVAALAAKAASLGAVKSVAHTAGLSGNQAPAAAVLAVDLEGFAYSLDAFGEVIAPGGAGVYIASMAGRVGAGAFTREDEALIQRTPSAELAALPWFAPENVDSYGAYSLAKRVNQLRIPAASLQWGARGARVNSISPGTIATPMGRTELESEHGALMRMLIEKSGTGRIGTPVDIANAAAFLLGPESSFITGTDLLVDGGETAAIELGAIDPALLPPTE